MLQCRSYKFKMIFFLIIFEDFSTGVISIRRPRLNKANFMQKLLVVCGSSGLPFDPPNTKQNTNQKHISNKKTSFFKKSRAVFSQL